MTFTLADGTQIARQVKQAADSGCQIGLVIGGGNILRGAQFKGLHAGIQEATARARSWADLPAQAIKYVRWIEELIGCPVALLSTSPERQDTILMRNSFEA